jgi:hypothetical protein
MPLQRTRFRASLGRSPLNGGSLDGPCLRALERLVLFATVLAVSSCQFDPYTSDYATTQPNPTALIGSWYPTPETVEKLSKSAYSALRPRIDVLKDGSIRLADIPDTWTSPFGEGKGKSEQFAGRWKLTRHQDRWWGLELSNGSWGCYGCLMVLRNEPPHVLVLRYGDPDLGWGYEFQRAV